MGLVVVVVLLVGWSGRVGFFGVFCYFVFFLAGICYAIDSNRRNFGKVE